MGHVILWVEKIMVKKKSKYSSFILILIGVVLLYFLSESIVLPSSQQAMSAEGYMDFTHYICEDELCENEIGVPVSGFIIEDGKLKEKDVYSEIQSSTHPLVMDQEEIDTYSGIYNLYNKISNVFQAQSIIRCTGDACETEQRKKLKEGEKCVLVLGCEETNEGFIDVLFCGKKDIGQIEDYCFGDGLREEANNYLLQSATPYAIGDQLQACNPMIFGYVDCEQAEHQWYKGGSNPRWTNRKVQQAYTSSGNADLNKHVLDSGEVVFAPWELRMKINDIECEGDKVWVDYWNPERGLYYLEDIDEECGRISTNYNVYHYYSGNRQLYPSGDGIISGGCGKYAMHPPSGEWVCCGKHACYGNPKYFKGGIPTKLQIDATKKASLPQSDCSGSGICLDGMTYLYTVSRTSYCRFRDRTLMLLILRHNIPTNIVDCVHDSDCSGDLACIEGQCMTKLWESRESNIGFMDNFMLAPGESFEKEFILAVGDIKPSTTSSFEFDVSAQDETAISKSFLLEFENE